MSFFQLVKPKWIPPLEEEFRPASLANRAFLAEAETLSEPLIFGLERENGKISRFETHVFPEKHPRAGANLYYAERLLKFLLWQRGGFQGVCWRSAQHRTISSGGIRSWRRSPVRFLLHGRAGL